MDINTRVYFFCRQLIYNYPEQLFSDSGVMAIEHADFEGVERLALVTGQFSWFCHEDGGYVRCVFDKVSRSLMIVC